MEPTFAILLLITCSIGGLCASMRTFLIVTAIAVFLLGFGPVAYQYAQTGDGSLIWEAAFQAALLAIAGIAANAYLKFNDGLARHN